MHEIFAHTANGVCADALARIPLCVLNGADSTPDLTCEHSSPNRAAVAGNRRPSTYRLSLLVLVPYRCPMKLAFALLLIPAPALAHPHVFVDASIEVIFDADRRATGLRIGWTYDDLFSLMIVEDRGLDPDYDSILTDTDKARLAGFDMQWEEGFPGDTYALLGGADQPLSSPSGFTASYDGGKITSTHVRMFDAPLAIETDPLVIQVYDPGFYTSYAIVTAPVLTGGAGCSAQVFTPDLAAAEAIYLAAISKMAGSADVEGNFPAIGAAYAEEARITCAAP
jgi:ABC-type uncharacterized transport system substrate-binding protein